MIHMSITCASMASFAIFNLKSVTNALAEKKFLKDSLNSEINFVIHTIN